MRIALVALWLIQQSVVGLATFLVAPVQIHAITRTFYDCVAADDRFAALRDRPPELPARQGSTLLDRVLGRLWGVLGLWLVVVLVLAIPGGLMVDALVRTHEKIHVVGHRAGGFGTPENSLTGLEFAIKQGAWGVEVDVQRTSTSMQARPSSACRRWRSFCGPPRGGPRSSSSSREPAPIRRWPTASSRHIERKTPAIDTGYLYFLSIGDVANLDGDYLILEEGEATDARLIDISGAGKKAIWARPEISGR